MIKEFKQFISQGNAFDMAIGLIIGMAFSTIVNSTVNDLLMPLIGIILGGIDFTGLSIKIGNAVITYGKLIQSIINFLIIGFALFMIVKAMNTLKTKKEEAPAGPTKDQELLTEIRDLLKSGK